MAGGAVRKLIVSVVVGAAVLVGTGAPAQAAPKGPRPTAIKAKAVALNLNGKTIWGENANAKRPIASLTKVMTAIVVLRQETNLGRTLKIKKKYTTYGDKWNASEAGLVIGDKVKVRDLLYGALLESGADATAALADAYGPGYKNFVSKMNANAKRLGLKKTHYANFDGLPYPSQTSTYSTAAEQIKLAEYALRFPTIQKAAAAKKVTIRTAKNRSYTFKNTNRLIGKYPGVLGIKTGYTNGAGYCFMFAAKRGKRTQIGIILGSPTEKRRFYDAKRMLDWGFSG
ncbi:D-alanyl-D-alanine carboxypeptidase family protein [Actinocorallia aurantiaca]|jgi:D-alanyl-D-alanine carboxypeptidase (penicillin-binding protein 5/6)|uniref:Serine hydrolase n=1 Tax=Actinocorallia aurantiaca TaxID=46204 RepID=A0ABN3TUG4_9ACTN